VAGTLALAVAARVPLEQAARLANWAARVAVGKVGTAPVTLDELLAVLPDEPLAVLPDEEETDSLVTSSAAPVYPYEDQNW
jgi:bifunctional ADP-heptose synthase (sugar kinase/adenylyltransferase)